MKTSWPSFCMWRAVRDQKCNGASSSATTRGPNSPLVKLPENSSSPTSVSADAETYFLQTTSCQNSKRSDGFLSEVVKLCFTQARLRSCDVPDGHDVLVGASKRYATTLRNGVERRKLLRKPIWGRRPRLRPPSIARRRRQNSSSRRLLRKRLRLRRSSPRRNACRSAWRRSAGRRPVRRGCSSPDDPSRRRARCCRSSRRRAADRGRAARPAGGSGVAFTGRVGIGKRS